MASLRLGPCLRWVGRHVRYEDGDEEDFSTEEITPLLDCQRGAADEAQDASSGSAEREATVTRRQSRGRERTRKRRRRRGGYPGRDAAVTPAGVSTTAVPTDASDGATARRGMKHRRPRGRAPKHADGTRKRWDALAGQWEESNARTEQPAAEAPAQAPAASPSPARSPLQQGDQQTAATTDNGADDGGGVGTRGVKRKAAAVAPPQDAAQQRTGGGGGGDSGAGGAGVRRSGRAKPQRGARSAGSAGSASSCAECGAACRRHKWYGSEWRSSGCSEQVVSVGGANVVSIRHTNVAYSSFLKAAYIASMRAGTMAGTAPCTMACAKLATSHGTAPRRRRSVWTW